MESIKEWHVRIFDTAFLVCYLGHETRKHLGPLLTACRCTPKKSIADCEHCEGMRRVNTYDLRYSDA